LYLLDTSIILELLLDQERADEVEQLLRETQSGRLHLTEFTLYSLGIIIVRRKLPETFLQAVDELLGAAAVRLVRLLVRDMKAVADNCRRFNLDFDDAYQYTAAEKRNLQIVSFDRDFERTPKGRTTPTEILAR
jgi:predicted nucleic acid-binding protein